MNKIKKTIEYAVLFVIYGTIYFSIEIMYRGYSHWSMWLLGGLCGVLVGLINEILSWKTPLCIQVTIGGCIVTVLEFIVGVIVNIILKLNVWDYSAMPLNVLGQICIPFTILWILLSVVCILVDDYIRYWLFNEEKPHYKLF